MMESLILPSTLEVATEPVIPAVEPVVAAIEPVVAAVEHVVPAVAAVEPVVPAVEPAVPEVAAVEPAVPEVAAVEQAIKPVIELNEIEQALVENIFQTALKDFLRDIEAKEELPPLVEDVSEAESDDDLMIAVFRKPECSRCEAMWKVLLTHETPKKVGIVEESEESEDSDSDYVPSETESETESESESETESESESETESEERPKDGVPRIIQNLFVLLMFLYLLQLASPVPRRCYS